MTSFANAGRFVPFAMKYGGTVGAGKKRLFLPKFLKGTLPSYWKVYNNFNNVRINYDSTNFAIQWVISLLETIVPMHVDPKMPYEAELEKTSSYFQKKI